MQNKLKQKRQTLQKENKLADIKHVGRIKASGRKCLVVFRTLPNEAYNCLVILTEHLSPSYHDSLINLVESNAGQTAYEFADVLNRNIFSDGTNMLQSLHVQGLLTKLPTDAVEMTPNSSSTVSLAELNQLIAEHQGVSVQDLAIKEDPKKNVEISEIAQVKELTNPVNDDAVVVADEHPLTDAELARKYRSDADRLSKEAAELRRMAEDLVPTKKATTSSAKSATAKKKSAA